MKILKILLCVTFILLLSLFSYIYVTLNISKPLMAGQVLTQGVQNEVEILRDNEGIPHIYAKTRSDMYYALGFVMGSDRLFQYDIIRRAGAGRLSEVIGSKTKEVDILFRNLGADIVFKKRVNDLPEYIKEDFKNFTAGLNYYADNFPLPLEFKILGYKPEPFTIMDAYYVYTYMAYSFSPMLKEDLLHTNIAKFIKDRDVSLLTSVGKKEILTDIDFKSMPSFEAAISHIKIVDDILANLGPIEGSNAWLVSGAKTKSGKPILSSDPHITFSLPNLWYEANLNCEEDNYQMYGHFLPLIPYPAMGHNEVYGWGLTMSYTDDLDLFQEEIIGNQFRMNNELIDIKTYPQIIKIKGEADYQFDIKWTRGPLVDPIIKTKDVSMDWAYYLPENRPLMAFYGIGRDVKNMSDFERGVKLGKSPGLNIMYADRDGHIAHFVFGSLFQRSNPDSSHIINNSTDLILGEYEYELKHHRIDPADGILVSTNDRPDISRVELKGLWYPKNRHDTVQSLLAPVNDWTIDSMRAVQTSNLDIFSKRFSRIILSSIEGRELNEVELNARSALLKWDSKSHLKSVGASIYHHFNYHFFPVVLDELTREMMEQYALSTGSWNFYQRIMSDPTNLWWDIKSTKELETRNEALFIIFKNTVADLQDKFGSNVEKWTWDRLHTITFPHPFGMSKLMGKFFNLGPYPMPGAINVVNHNRRKGYRDGHAVGSGPSTRRIIDFANPDISYGILPLGNSGHQLSPFFDNQRERFISGQYRRQYLKKEDVKKNLYSSMSLAPIK